MYDKFLAQACSLAAKGHEAQGSLGNSLASPPDPTGPEPLSTTGSCAESFRFLVCGYAPPPQIIKYVFRGMPPELFRFVGMFCVNLSSCMLLHGNPDICRHVTPILVCWWWC